MAVAPIEDRHEEPTPAARGANIAPPKFRDSAAAPAQSPGLSDDFDAGDVLASTITRMSEAHGAAVVASHELAIIKESIDKATQSLGVAGRAVDRANDAIEVAKSQTLIGRLNGPVARKSATFLAIGVPLLLSGYFLQARSPNPTPSAPHDVHQRQLAAEAERTGVELAHKGMFREAMDKLDFAIGIAPTPYLLCERAHARFRVNEIEGALDDCAKALTIDGRYGRAYYIRHVILSGQGEKTRAASDLRMAVHLGDPVALIQSTANANKR